MGDVAGVAADVVVHCAAHFTVRIAAPVAVTCALLVLALAAGCAAPPPARGLSDLMERPGERALFEGMRAYDDGQYAPAEAALRKALAAGLASHRDRASAHKLLAFITCTSERVAECDAAFRAARAADPAFVLTKSEAGHPLWGPVYRKALP